VHFYNPYEGHTPIATNIYIDGDKQSTLDNPNEYRGQIFQPRANFTVSRVRLKIQRVGGKVGQDLIVEIREIDSTFNPTGPVLSYGVKCFTEIFFDIEAAWYPIHMTKGQIWKHKQYAIIVRLDVADAENKLLWPINNNGYPNGYAIWTNNGPDETGAWMYNENDDRMFEIWGKKI
jgi:hypothetical protein